MNIEILKIDDSTGTSAKIFQLAENCIIAGICDGRGQVISCAAFNSRDDACAAINLFYGATIITNATKNHSTFDEICANAFYAIIANEGWTVESWLQHIN